jgi:hypothetical protein
MRFCSWLFIITVQSGLTLGKAQVPYHHCHLSLRAIDNASRHVLMIDLIENDFL